LKRVAVTLVAPTAGAFPPAKSELLLPDAELFVVPRRMPPVLLCVDENASCSAVVEERTEEYAGLAPMLLNVTVVSRVPLALVLVNVLEDEVVIVA
jgi:hypothetical protein